MINNGGNMNILVINSGSSSLKFQLLNMVNEDLLVSGLVERIGIDGSRLILKKDQEKYTLEKDLSNHDEALRFVLETLVDKKYHIIDSLEEINAVGHRVVHGGEEYTESVVVNEDVLKGIEACIELAPLHNPANLTGIKAIEKLLPNVKNVAVFDTAFHSSMKEEAYIYPLPYEYYENYKVRRYGFHGTSHRFVSRKAAEILGVDYNNFKVITCHLGNGASIAAVKNGKSIDTSMGFTPLEGLVMGTRSGDIDPAIIEFIANKEGKSISEVLTVLNKKSGVLGVSGVSSDFRDIEGAAAEGNKRAALALKVFRRRVAKYIAAYTALLDGTDAILFTGGLGENSATDREIICDMLSFMGVELDKEYNKTRPKNAVISTEASSVKVLVVETNEELAIARDTKELVK